MMDIVTLEREVLSLDRQTRGQLVTKLLRSLDEDADEDVLSDEEIKGLWLREVERRSKEIEDDPSGLIPGDQVMREMRELLK